MTAPRGDSDDQIVTLQLPRGEAEMLRSFVRDMAAARRLFRMMAWFTGGSLTMVMLAWYGWSIWHAMHTDGAIPSIGAH